MISGKLNRKLRICGVVTTDHAFSPQLMSKLFFFFSISFNKNMWKVAFIMILIQRGKQDFAALVFVSLFINFFMIVPGGRCRAGRSMFDGLFLVDFFYNLFISIWYLSNIFFFVCIFFFYSLHLYKSVCRSAAFKSIRHASINEASSHFRHIIIMNSPENLVILVASGNIQSPMASR